ncbi:MAG: TonB-dependent receptor [Pseudomonadales bacterium]|mgnify:CR=1 FL=1|jgi:outer membrane receptor protein involved in Fe transport|tara:strand:+ start:177 stop:584 length:408 start_codon:yes stop_codon:yes gene_type:complete
MSATSHSWSHWTGKIGVEYTPSEDVFLFANVSNGFKAGGINIGSLTGAFDEETLINYEVGVKSTMADGTLRANLTAYYSDFDGYQLQAIDGIVTTIINGVPILIDDELTGARSAQVQSLSCVRCLNDAKKRVGPL